jgi:hypothetical protein
MKDIVFFCQAPADIVHILKEYEDLKTKYADDLQVEIVCVNSKVLLDYFNNIQLQEIKVIYLEYTPVPIKKIWKIRSWKKKVMESIKKSGFLSGDKSFYFCSICDDLLTTYFMNLLYTHNKKIVYLNHYDDTQNISALKKISAKQKLVEILYYRTTGIKYKFWNLSDRWTCIRFPIESVNFEIKYPILDNAICKKYAYRIYPNAKDQTVLFFSQPNREKNVIDDNEHDSLNIQIISKLKDSGYKIYAKGHPRIGICNSISRLIDEEIPQFIPSELIDITMFKFCIGFVTIAMSSSAKLGIPTYSFIPLVKNHNSYYDGLMKFMMTSGENKIKFIDSLDELAKI